MQQINQLLSKNNRLDELMMSTCGNSFVSLSVSCNDMTSCLPGKRLCLNARHTGLERRIPNVFACDRIGSEIIFDACCGTP